MGHGSSPYGGGVLSAALPPCPRSRAVLPALRMLRAPEGLAQLPGRVMVGTRVLGEHVVVLVPSTGRGAATRWGTQAT